MRSYASGIVGAALLQQTPAALFVEDRGPSCFSLRIEPVERIGDQLGTVEVAGVAGDIGGAVDDLGANREVGGGDVVIVEHRKQPVVVALGLGQGIGKLGVDSSGEGRGDGPVGCAPAVQWWTRAAAHPPPTSAWSKSMARAYACRPDRSPGSSSSSTASWTRAWRKA